MALIPNQHIDCQVLATEANHRTVLQVLNHSIAELQEFTSKTENLQTKLQQTKESLLSESSEEFEETEPDGTRKCLQTLIILDEFCKEMTAILFAKKHVWRICNNKLGQ